MTLDQTQFRQTSGHPAHGTEADILDAAGPQVWEDMTVEVALSVMAAARTRHLVVCDEDGLCTGLVTRARLTAVRDGSGFTDRIRLRDIADLIGPFVSPPTTEAEAERAMHRRLLGAAPVMDEHGNTSGRPHPLPLNRPHPTRLRHLVSLEASCAVSSPASRST